MFHIIRNNFICIFAIMTLFAQTAPVAAKIISGTVTDKCASPLFGADVVALPKKEKEALKTQTNENGHFTLDVPAETKEIRISYLGFKPITYPVDKVPESIKLDRDPDLNDVDKVSECRKLGSDTTLGVAVVVAEWCTQDKKDAINATEAYHPSGTQQCIPTVCKDSYELKVKTPLMKDDKQVKDKKGNDVFSDAQCVEITGRNCSPMPENAAIAKIENGECIIKKCNEPQYKLVDNNCVDQVGTDCKSQVAHAVEATYQMENGSLKCMVTKCEEPGWVHSEAGTRCEESNGPCTAEQIAAVAHATSGSLRKGKCIITACESGWHVSKDGSSCDQAELSEEDSKNKVSELKDNAQKMKDKEQSTANKALGAAAIGATGIGGMNLMSGMAEQKADDAAEEDMKAYLATFVCDYGQGRNIKGGERDIDLPGGNELLTQVNEYKALAADLKIRKEALGKTPGIEAEVIYDIAETGLYDNVGMGRQSGAYASVSKALMDENSDDAKAWAEQKADTASKIKTGAITAGIGAIGGLVGNLAINSGEKNKNKVDEINQKYKNKALGVLEEKVNNTPPHTVTCPDGKTVRSDNLQCVCEANKQYNPNQNTCDACIGGQTSDGTTKCECPADKPLWDTTKQMCITNPTTCTAQCTPTDGDHLQLLADGCTCTCADGYDFVAATDTEVAKCVCNEAKSENAETGICETVKIVNQEPQNNPGYETILLNASAMFKIGTADFVEGSTIKSDLQNMYSQFDKNQTCDLLIKGYTDPVGSNATNSILSQKRADAIKTKITEIIDADTSTDKPTIKIYAIGNGETECSCGVAKQLGIDVVTKSADADYNICYDTATSTAKPDNTQVTGNDKFAPCRRIEVTTSCKSTQSASQS